MIARRCSPAAVTARLHQQHSGSPQQQQQQWAALALTTARTTSSSTSTSTTQQSATLYSEWYRPSAELSTTDDGAQRPIVFLHGLLGNVRNIKTMAKKMCDIKGVPGLLLDLTGHGRSSIHSTVGSVTFDRVCSDIEITLQEALSSNNNNNNYHYDSKKGFTFVGHSLGGRLALQYAYQRRSPSPTSLWLLDTVPGQPDESVLGVLNAAHLVSQRHTWRSRAELTTALVEAYQFPLSVSEWLAAQYDIQYQRFNFDMRAAESLADDFGSQNFWQQLDQLLLLASSSSLPRVALNNNHDNNNNNNNNNDPTTVKTIHLISGGMNEAWGPALPAVEERAVRYPGAFVHHVLPKAVHWVHADDLPGLLRAFESAARW
jgi:pimeloyl-ACP methyl ester carboxylesterase